MGFESEWWLTYRQAQSMGGHVHKGEKGTPACFWKIVDDPRCPACRRESARHRRECRRRVVLNAFTAFNLEQIEGIEYPKTERAERPPFEAIEAGDAIAKGYASMWRRDRLSLPDRVDVDRLAILDDAVLYTSVEVWLSDTRRGAHEASERN